MTAMELAAMDENGPEIGRRIVRIALLIAASLGGLFAIGVVVGLLAGHAERGGPLDARLIGLIAAAALLALGCAYAGYRALRGIAAEDPGTSRERRGRIVFLSCFALGVAMGIALTLGGESPLAGFSDAPISPVLAVVLAAITVILLPLVCLYWHRRVADEQEKAAYGAGVLLAIYAYWIGAPAWWLLWRGGLVPAPDGVLIYFATIAVAAIGWLHAKYR